jgi:hypothetical protein
LLHQLRARSSNHQHHLHQQQKEAAAGPETTAGCHCAAADRHEVVLIVTSDFTHAGPWYRELPPAGVALADYMAAQDSPLLQVRLGGPAGTRISTHKSLWSAALLTMLSYCHICPLACMQADMSTFVTTSHECKA